VEGFFWREEKEVFSLFLLTIKLVDVITASSKKNDRVEIKIIFFCLLVNFMIIYF
jgi:hypothetical protein